MLQLLRPWAFFRDAVYEPKEFKRIRDTVRGPQLNELTLGILGMGRVGRRVGHIATRGFGMRVIYNDLLDVAGQSGFPRDGRRQADALSRSGRAEPARDDAAGE